MIKIISDGTPVGTKVYNDDGSLIEGVTRINFHPLQVGEELWQVEITFICPELEIQANWATHPLKLWANKRTGKSNQKTNSLKH